MDVSLKNFIECDRNLLLEVLNWRNYINVRLNSLNQKEINIEEHFNFINDLKENKTKLYFLVLQKDIYLGVISFTNINSTSAYIGYYKNPFLNISGVGDILIKSAVEYAYDILELKEVYMEALINNSVSQHLILKQGFKEVSRDEKVVEYLLRLI